jgi:hypothetical protein
MNTSAALVLFFLLDLDLIQCVFLRHVALNKIWHSEMGKDLGPVSTLRAA